MSETITMDVHEWAGLVQRANGKPTPADGLQAQIAALAEGLRARDASIKALAEQNSMLAAHIQSGFVNLAQRLNMISEQFTDLNGGLSEQFSTLTDHMITTQNWVKVAKEESAVAISGIESKLESTDRIVRQMAMYSAQSQSNQALGGKQRRRKKR